MKLQYQNKPLFSFALIVVLLLTFTFSATSCFMETSDVSAKDLTEGISPSAVDERIIDDIFINNTANFTINLFQKTITEKENSLVSPLSVLLALAMTANGADTETLTQMETVLAGDIKLADLNEYLYSYSKSLPSESKSKFNIANSIWFRDNESQLVVEKDFLQKNADYYHAAIYKSAFDNQTLNEINNWVKDKTDGLIDSILDEIDSDTVMYLINAIIFDAEWKTVYSLENVYQDTFITEDGEKQTTDFMRSEESLFIDDGKATGFIKPYAGDNYSFVALLPNEGISIENYINSLTGDKLIKTIQSASSQMVNASLPKFSYDYKITMNDALKEMGMPLGFSPTQADFNRLGRSPMGNIYIGEVLHKTFIAVDELGTKAGAVTKVEMKAESAIEMKNVILNRPFVYAIIDQSTNLPLFIGTVVNIK